MFTNRDVSRLLFTRYQETKECCKEIDTVTKYSMYIGSCNLIPETHFSLLVDYVLVPSDVVVETLKTFLKSRVDLLQRRRFLFPDAATCRYGRGELFETTSFGVDDDVCLPG